MTTQRGRRIAIVGAGFSGSLLAVQLLRRSEPEDRVYLIERSAGFGRGLAYATGNPHHLLNVRAGNMSAFSDQPDHFLDWLRSIPESERAQVSVSEDRLTFVSRQLYGSYIQHILGREIRSAESSHRLYLVADETVALHPGLDGCSVEVGCGRRYEVDAVALAVGNFPPQGGSRGYVANPWDPAATADLDPDAPVLLVGTGLTMVDVVVSLLDQKHRGPILAVSRRGLLPRRHAAIAPHPRFLQAVSAPRTLLGLLRAVRLEIARAASAGRDWRAVIDAIRPDTQDLWRNLPLPEKKRFLRHLRPWWDVHRHRMAPSVAMRIEAALARKQLEIRRARLGKLAPRRGGVDVELLPVRGAPVQHVEVDRVINCSGPFSEITRVGAPLIQDLLDRGAARPDPLNLGLDVTAEGAIVDSAGRARRDLFAVGPITKGVFWETVAVPDIRIQCERLAQQILQQVEAKPRRRNPAGLAEDLIASP
jgi:uncharacterized NAD(P)/FAD-binding protein YdhS